MSEVTARVGVLHHLVHQLLPRRLGDVGLEASGKRRGDDSGQDAAHDVAKPVVEPSARCALMIPDAMPARSGGTEAMATFVVGAMARPAAAPARNRPRMTMPSGLPTPTMTAARPVTEGEPGQRRAPTAVASGESAAMGASTIVGTVNASMITPVVSGL